MSPADFLHGPNAMIERAFPVFAFAPPSVTWPSMREVLTRLRQMKAETLIITDRSNREAMKDFGPAICVPAKLDAHRLAPEDAFTPIPYIIPAQLFAAHLAVQKGYDPDRPRTLSKITRTM
jgi:glucosamine--fructose-6-phosphate aminotransferase (isomerizing)